MYKEVKIEFFWLTEGEVQESFQNLTCSPSCSHYPPSRARYSPSAAVKPICYAGHSLNYT